MNKCTNCGYATESNINFCPTCGGKIVPEAPAYTEPQTPTYTNITPVYQPYTPPRPQVSKAKKIVGMALSIAGFIFSLLALIYGLLYGLIMGAAGVFMAFYLSAFSLPLCAVGLAFSRSAINLGDTSAFSRLGKIFGLIGIILSCVAMFLSFIMGVSGCSMMDDIYYNGYYY